MFVVHIAIALAVAALLSLIFAIGFRTRGPWGSILVFFAVIFLSSWAGGLWLPSMGPPLWGVYWIPFLLAGVIIALVLIATVAPERPKSTVKLVEPGEQATAAGRARSVLGIFFWILIAALVVAIVSRYV